MPATESLAALTSSLPVDQRQALLDDLTDAEAEALEYDWGYWGRANQHPPPGEWRIWLLLAGRGFGKTRTGAEWVRACVREFPLVNIIGPTADDARDVMVAGESGILAVCPPRERPVYRKSERSLDWPNGAKTLIFTADEPERLRGKQHMRLWADELAAWRYPDAWDQALFGLRLGADPRALVTTTPKPVTLVRDLLAREGDDVAVRRGTTRDNADNLAPAFLDRIIRRYEGTRMGRQEIEGEYLDDVEGALWTRKLIEDARVTKAPDLARVVVAVDPAVTSGEDADESGIVVAARAVDGHAYVVADLSCRLSPDGWARRAVGAYHEYRADRLVAEVNNGGDLVERVIRTVDPAVSYRKVIASRGKRVRAEPVAALYEQGRVHHVGGFAALEDQMCQFVPDNLDGSPDRVDALVWALTELMLSRREHRGVAA